jgi:hypothetical protein
VRFLVFGLGLFELDLVDLDTVFGVAETGVVGECVSWGDVTAAGCFGEDTVFGASKGLKSTL